MVWFVNRKNGRKFQVTADRAPLFEARPLSYQPVDQEDVDASDRDDDDHGASPSDVG